MKNYSLTLLVIIGIAITWQSCKKEKASPIPITIDDTSDTAKVDTISFAASILPILTTNCSYSSNCHNSGSGFGDFTSYAGFSIDATNGNVMDRVIKFKNMPPTYASGPTSLSAQDIALIDKWIKQGALNN